MRIHDTDLHVGDRLVFRGLTGQSVLEDVEYEVRKITVSGELVLASALRGEAVPPGGDSVRVPIERMPILLDQRIWELLDPGAQT